MQKQISIYVRKSGDRNLLMLHVPEDMKELLISGIQNGSFEADSASINLQLAALDEWGNPSVPGHLSIEINEITANYEG